MGYNPYFNVNGGQAQRPLKRVRRIPRESTDVITEYKYGISCWKPFSSGPFY